MTDIVRITTPPGGWKGEMPGPFLPPNEQLATHATDLRGTWKAHEVFVQGERAPKEFPLWSHVERIEQSGSRVIITGGGIIHDFPIADGTIENGCHDVAATDKTTPIRVAASFENDVLVLRPADMPGVEVKRWLDGEFLMWQYHTLFSMRLERSY